MNSLNDDIQTFLANIKSQIPPPVFSRLEAVLMRLDKARIGADAPRAGDRVPAVSFADTRSNEIGIDALYADQPLVLVFYRGGWCPFCDLTLRAYDAVHEQIKASGARLVAVSPQTVAEINQTSQSRKLSFEVLSDSRNAAAKAFGLAWRLTEPERELYKAFESDLERFNGNKDWELPAPAVFVINREGIIVWSQVDADYTKRAEPAGVLTALQTVQPNRIKVFSV